MPIDPMSLLQVGESIAQPILQGVQNRANRKFAMKMYDRQRQDSLKDWAMQNEYNSPSSQMARLKSAGLNPNLVYGNGVSGASGMATPVRSSQASTPQGEAPHLNVLGAYQNMKLMQAQIDNVRTATTVKQQDALLRSAQYASTLLKNSKDKIELKYADELKKYSLAASVAGLDKIQAQTDLIKGQYQWSASANLRAEEMQYIKVEAGRKSIEKLAEEILLTRARTTQSEEEKKKIMQQIENLKKDNTLQQLEIDLRSKGVTYHDPLWQRIVALGISNFL